MKVDLHAQVTLADIGAGVARFFRWWGGELFALLPAKWRAAYARWQKRSVLSEEGTHWTIAEDDVPAFSFDTAHADDVLREALVRDAPEVFERSLDVVLSRDDVLIRRMELPDAAASRLRSTVGLQIERLSPFRAEDIGFDCRTDGRDETQAKTLVEICIVPRKTMSRFEARLQALGLSADWFRIEGTPFRVRSDAGTARDAGRRRLTLALSGAAVLLWLGVAIFTPIARELDIASATDQIATLRPAAERAFALKAQVAALQEPARLAAAKAAQVRPIDVLKSLTAVLPNSVRIVEFSIEGRRVSLTGVASDAASLIAVLERSGRFSTVHFRGPLKRRPDGSDQFHLEMNVAPTRPAGTT